MGNALDSSGSNSRQNRWYAYALPLTVILLFAAGVFDFATLKRTHLPAHKRVNNGWTPTFFAFHISPSYNFSEDFHLYYVRAKRIERRGWTDSLFYSRPDAKACYSAPLQVMLSRLALLTEGAPRRYAIYMFATLAVGWTTLYVVARKWLPREIATATILLAVLITVLFEALHFIVSTPRFESFGQWPTFRALRMSTMSWTSPLLVAMMIILSSLLYNRDRWFARCGMLGLMLTLFLGTDNWAFAMAWFGTGLAAAWIGVQSITRWRQTSVRPYADWRIMVAMGLVMLLTFGVHQAINGSLEGDALLRGGMGSEWADTQDRDSNVERLSQWFAKYALVPLIGVLLLSVVELRRKRPQSAPPLELTTSAWSQLRALAVLPVAVALTVNFVLDWRGMECYLRSQIFWRTDYCLLFALVVTLGEWMRTSLPVIIKRSAHAWPIIIALAISALFAYHCYRMHWFVKHTARRDFFLTADAQGLRPWLEKFDREHEKYELATASLELNYLSAFWTNADLLLPSGFPYHNGASNEEIEDRAMQLFRLFNTSNEAWLAITEPNGERFTDMWLNSRVRASGRGYLYHFFHRWAYLWPPDQPLWCDTERQVIADALCQPVDDESKPTPEVILVDDVSRALGSPDLANYRLMHRSGSIEAWVRCDVAYP